MVEKKKSEEIGGDQDNPELVEDNILSTRRELLWEDQRATPDQLLSKTYYHKSPDTIIFNILLILIGC